MDIVTLGAALNGAKAYTDATIAPLLGGVHYRGSVNYFDNLPSNPAEGDAYTVKYSGASGTSPDGTEYVWALDTDDNTYKWIGFSPDTYTKAEVDNLLNGKQATIDSSHKLSADLVDDTLTTHKFATAAQLQQIETNKTNISNIETSLSSTNSDAGKVLTADGEGGYAWQPASGGGTAKYLYQFNITISSNAPNSKTRFSGVLVSDNPNLQIDGSLPNRAAVLEYLKFNREFTPDYDYYHIVNINTITVNNNSSSNADFVPVSYARYRRSTNQLLLQTATEEKAILILDNDTANIIRAAITAL